MNKKKLILLIGTLIIASILSLLNNLAYGLTAILWLFILFPATGYMLLDHFPITKRLSVGEWVGYIIGLSLIFLILFGLLVNTLGLLLHYPALETRSIVLSFAIAFIGLLLLKKLHPTYVLRQKLELTNEGI